MTTVENPYERFRSEELILRDELAVDRTMLANERTLLAYVRTAMTFAVVGGTLLKFLDSPGSLVLGWSSLVVAAVVLIAGIKRTVLMQRRIGAVRGMFKGFAGKA